MTYCSPPFLVNNTLILSGIDLIVNPIKIVDFIDFCAAERPLDWQFILDSILTIPLFFTILQLIVVILLKLLLYLFRWWVMVYHSVTNLPFVQNKMLRLLYHYRLGSSQLS